jgi:hypothetical protein
VNQKTKGVDSIKKLAKVRGQFIKNQGAYNVWHSAFSLYRVGCFLCHIGLQQFN